MSLTEIPNGHPGNLSEEQNVCLKQMWAGIFALSGMGEVLPNGSDIPAVDISESSKIVNEIGDEKFHSALCAPIVSEHPDVLPLRFLRARKWDVKRALVMLATMIKWRIDLNVDKIMENGEEVLNKEMAGFVLQLNTRKAYVHGVDKINRPVFYIHVKLHDPRQQTFEELRTFTIYNMEIARLLFTPPTNQACLVFDMTDFGLKNMDWMFILFLVKAFEAYYPETLGTMAIHKAPWIFSGIWKVLSPLLDPVVANKVVFTRTDKHLLEYIDASRLPKGLNGDEDWVFEYSDVVEGENARFKDAQAKKDWQDKRTSLRDRFEEKTRVWIQSKSESAALERERAVLEYCIATIQADPYLRPRSVYHRHGNIREDGTVVWNYNSTAESQTFGVSISVMKQKLAESSSIQGTNGIAAHNSVGVVGDEGIANSEVGPAGAEA